MATAKTVFTAAEQKVVNATDDVISAGITLREAVIALCGGMGNILTDAAATAMKTVMEKVRKFNGEVVAVDALRKQKEPARQRAVNRYDTISKEWIGLRKDAKNEPRSNGKGRAIPVLITAKQHEQFCNKQVAELSKREKADFDISRLKACYMEAAKIAAAGIKKASSK